MTPAKREQGCGTGSLSKKALRSLAFRENLIYRTPWMINN
jgi:hypothetical protein